MPEPEPEFAVTGVRIGRWLRSLTIAGQVLIRDGRLELLNSQGSVIDVHLNVVDGETKRIVPAADVHSFALQIIIEIMVCM